MDEEVFSFSDWYKALTLSERASALARSPGRNAEADDALADRRLDRWREQEPFSQDGYFARRLALDGLTEAGLHTLLGEPTAAVRERESASPAWLLTLEEAFRRPAPETFPAVPSESPSIGFLDAVRPLLDTAYSRLVDGIREIGKRYPGSPFDASTAGPLLAANLPSSLLLRMSRTMVLELQLARRQGQLAGETPEERFRSFVESLRTPEVALAILRQYPVLARMVVETLDRWKEVSLELLERLAADWTDLLALFAPDRSPGALVGVRTGLGDPHRCGRSVTLFRFSSGLRLIYKPKPLRVEVAFQDLLRWLGRKGFQPGFRTLRVLDRGRYGWIEFVEAGPCADEGAVRRFYRRQGGYLALLWLLEAVDIHWENLIAAGEHPVLVDLETLFQPRIHELGKEVDEARGGRVLEKTALTTGLLPSRAWIEGEGEGVELSGLAGTGGQTAPPALQTAHAGTDEMHYSLQPAKIHAGDNLPTLAGEAVPVSPYLGEVVDGFSCMARLFREHRQEMTAPEGPLAAFAEAEVRVVVRPTRSYALLLFETFHPYMLGDALDRDRLLDRLWLAAREHPVIERLMLAERDDLLHGDIPMFTTRPGTRDVWSWDGRRFADLQPDSGLERVSDRLASLDEGELSRQAWLVHNSLASLDLQLGSPAWYDFRPDDPPAGEELLAAAEAVGDRLAALALRGPRDAHWFAPQMVRIGSVHWELQPARLDLHLGLPGIALFLAWLGEILGAPRFTDLARAAVVTMNEQLRYGRKALSTIGAFSGWGGLVWTFTHLSALWGDEPLLAEAERIALEEIPPLVPEDTHSDLVAGASGCLIALLTLHGVRPSDRLAEVAVACGERVLARALPMASGVGWQMVLAGPTPLAGLSHGVAGIAWPLLRLATLTGDRRFHDTALAGLNYERSLYRPDQRNWPDLRQAVTPERTIEPGSMWAWCHGAPGIGLGRLAGLPYLDDETVRGEIETAVESTIENGFGGNHCLCHGDLGNLEVVTMAATRLGRPDWQERSGRLAGGILAGIRERGWLLGLPGRTESPGMMVGLAGIGYGLLRLAAPQRVPSVLVLEGPR
jgi:type 2 lantibiotic biosynthesis protein LanM